VGYVEVDSLIYELPEDLRDDIVAGKGVLRLLAQSIRIGCALRVAIEVEVRPALGPHNFVIEYGERIVARTEHTFGRPSEVKKIFAERTVPRRVCTIFGCGALLPSVGPDHCLAHVVTPPGY
jgi:hypothetical protein